MQNVILKGILIDDIHFIDKVRPFIDKVRSYMQEDDHVFIIILIMLIVLSVIEIIRVFKEYKKDDIHLFPLRSGLNKFPICIVTICFIIIGSVVLLSEYEMKDSLIIVCLSIVGFVGTIVGLIITYIQVKRSSNQFYGYHDFYTIADEILSKNKGRKIQFHFTAPIPGQIAFNKEHMFKNFEEKLIRYSGEKELIIPSPEKLMEAYYHYEGKTILKVKYTKEEIDKKLKPTIFEKRSCISVNSFLGNLMKKDESVGRTKNNGKTTIYSYDKDKQEAIENLYLSDGRTVVYAIPLHYLKIQDDINDDNAPSPELVGFVTTERGVVNALWDNFEQIKNESVLLEFPKNGAYIQ